MILIGMVSCELIKEIEFDPKYDGGKIIIHGFISPNDGVRVQINKSVPVNDTKMDDYIPDVQVVLYGNDIPIYNLIEADSGFFMSPQDSSLHEGVAYKIKVTTKDLGVAESGIQYILPEVIIDSLIYKKDTVTWKGERLLFYLNDPEESGNYYSIGYSAFYKDSLIESSFKAEAFVLRTFNDIQFNGEKIWEEISFYSSFYKYDTVQITGRLYNISGDFNHFLESLSEYEYTKETPFFDYTYPVYSNIKNGFGIFGSYSFSEKSLTRIKDQYK